MPTVAALLRTWSNRLHGRLEHVPWSEQMPDPGFVTKRSLRSELEAAGFIEDRTKGLLWYTSTWHSAA